MAKIILTIIDPEKYFGSLIRILKKEVKNKKVIYVTTNKPYEHIATILKKRKILYNKFFFIDCISKYVGQKIEEELQNCLLLESPQSLTNLSIAINESIKKIPGKKILFLDSLSMLLIYNDAPTLGKFSNFIINKMRSYDVDTVILTLESDVNKDIIKQLESFVDEVIKYGS